MKRLNSIVVDPYLEGSLCIDSLVENWKKHNGIIIAFGFDSNILLDDRAGLSAAYNILFETKERIKSETF